MLRKTLQQTNIVNKIARDVFARMSDSLLRKLLTVSIFLPLLNVPHSAGLTPRIHLRLGLQRPELVGGGADIAAVGGSIHGPGGEAEALGLGRALMTYQEYYHTDTD